MQKDETEISIIDVILILWRRKFIILGITVIMMIAAILYTGISLILPPEKSFLPNVYTAHARIYINSVSSHNLSALTGETGTLFGDVITAMGCDPALRAKMKKSIEKNFTIFYKQNILGIAFTDIDPQRAKQTVDIAVSYYEKQFFELEVLPTQREKEAVELAMKRALSEITILEDEILLLQQKKALSDSKSALPDWEALKREKFIQQQLYDNLRINYEIIKVKTEAAPPVFKIMQHADAPEAPSGPNRKKICAILTMAAFVGSIILIFLLSVFKKIIHDPEVINKFRSKNL